VPIYGMNLGTVGFLLNTYRADGLRERLEQAVPVPLHPLRMRAQCRNGKTEHGLGINEVSLFRETRQAAHLRIEIDGVMRLEQLVCDGVLVATTAGSTAYNLSAHGPILPVGANLLALTPISPFRPRRWRGALLPSRTQFRISVVDPDKRPVSAVADYTEIRDVVEVAVELIGPLAVAAYPPADGHGHLGHRSAVRGTAGWFWAVACGLNRTGFSGDHHGLWLAMNRTHRAYRSDTAQPIVGPHRSFRRYPDTAPP
jgi:hypothetical protein